MISDRFGKAYAEHLLDAIRLGQPLPVPPEKGWSVSDLLILAGSLYGAIVLPGPIKDRFQEIGLANLQPEERESVAATLRNDLHNAIGVLSSLGSRFADNEYVARLHA